MRNTFAETATLAAVFWAGFAFLVAIYEPASLLAPVFLWISGGAAFALTLVAIRQHHARRSADALHPVLRRASREDA